MDTVRHAFALAAAGDYPSLEQSRKRVRREARDAKHRQIEAGSRIFGTDGVFVGSVAEVDGDLIKLAASEIGLDSRPHHYIPLGLVDRVEQGMVQLRVKASEAVSFEKGTSTYHPVKAAPPA
jgi:hypothetical protein